MNLDVDFAVTDLEKFIQITRSSLNVYHEKCRSNFKNLSNKISPSIKLLKKSRLQKLMDGDSLLPS